MGNSKRTIEAPRKKSDSKALKITFHVALIIHIYVVFWICVGGK